MNDTHEEPGRGAGGEEPVGEAAGGAGEPGGESASGAGEPGGEAAVGAGEPVAEAPAAPPHPAPLSARDRDVLALEGESFTGPGAKERAVRERLGMSPTRYYQLLNALLDDPAAEAHAPVTVHRLRRVREARRAER
ncbi:DUF3263 domain-containing protein [Streptomyces sp. SID11385]|uniref:DUF3263 domain-containing protein n=1 Tax=Streptomyces sp. SID11385 TaxID=2706031 RepID=UPI0013C6026C|nr:DUF3263 domain-containing protein [Streptomyces sp. SID11385]NEA42624.1 DUF3263 domain-containing protein [Streptomyces sp. SID11385]